MSDLTKNVNGASGGVMGVGTTSAGLDVNVSSKVLTELKTDNAMQVLPSGDLLNKSLEGTVNDIINTHGVNFDSKSASLAALAEIRTPELEKIGKPYQGIVATMLPAKAFSPLQQGK